MTYDNLPFLRRDINIGEHRIIIFATDSNLGALCRADIIYGDGTFKCVPKLFKQLYTFHTFSGKSSIPRVFCLLTGKSSLIYTRLFEELKSLCKEVGLLFNPHKFMIAFESRMNL